MPTVSPIRLGLSSSLMDIQKDLLFFFVIKLRKRHNLNTQPPRNLTTNMSLLSICWTVLVAKCCLNIGWQFPCGNSKPYNFFFFFLLHFFYFVTELRLLDGLHPFNITSVTSQISIRVLCYLCTSLLEFGSPSHILTIVKH